MLTNLCIENVAVIEKVQIDFSCGLNILTGETGAGKSIIIDSLNAVLGERASKDMVRGGADFACVDALFTQLSNSVQGMLCELGVDLYGDTDLVLQRKITADGKSACRINGRPVTAAMLREIGHLLVNIHGQQDNQALLRPEKHIGFVDSMAQEIKALKAEFSECFEKLSAVKSELKKCCENNLEKERKLDLLNYQIEEIEQAGIEPGEFALLAEKKKQLVNGEKILSELHSALDSLYGVQEMPGAVELLRSASDSLSDCSRYFSEISASAQELTELYYTCEGLAQDIRDITERFDFSPSELETVEERLDLLHKLSKKYGADDEEILLFLENAKKEREAVELSEERLLSLKNEYDELYAEARELADRLSALRKATAEKFAESIMQELRFLDMPEISFAAQQQEIALNENGKDKIEFLISTNPGETPKPLAKIASGGELSRVMLAIKNVLADKDEVQTLIFDEIDTGVSGRAAQKIGRKLHQAAGTHQVVCVTHSAQVAAYADCHFLIQKSVSDGRTFTTVFPLDDDGRKHELARITGGEVITDLLLQNAQDMLDRAREQ